MKKAFLKIVPLLFVFSFSFFISVEAQTIDTTKFFIGVNWMNFNGNQSSVGKLYGDTLNSSIYHVGSNLDNTGDSSVNQSVKATWDSIINKFPANYIVDNYDGAITEYCRAERMLYQATDTSHILNKSDTLTHYFLQNTLSEIPLS